MTTDGLRSIERMSVRTVLEEAWAEWLKDTNAAGKRTQAWAWRRDNRAEWAAIVAYRAGTGPRPTLTSIPGLEHLRLTDAWLLTADPPDPPGFPPAYAQWSDDFDPAPASRWTWSNPRDNHDTFPSPYASLVDDGAGGKAVRLLSPTMGGNGALSSFYDGSGQWGQQGLHQLGMVQFRLVKHSTFIWVWEWHELAGVGVNSCAVGVNPNKTLRIQVSGGNPVGHQYTTLDVPGALVLDRWYLLEWDIVWSINSSGRFLVKLDGDTLINVSRPTLLIRSGGLPDTVVIGGYSYCPPGSLGDQSVDFRRFAVGLV